MSILDAKIKTVRRAAATRRFWAGVGVYGGVWNALRAYDSTSIREAILMLENSIKISIYKSGGQIIVEEK